MTERRQYIVNVSNCNVYDVRATGDYDFGYIASYLNQDAVSFVHRHTRKTLFTAVELCYGSITHSTNMTSVLFPTR